MLAESCGLRVEVEPRGIRIRIEDWNMTLEWALFVDMVISTGDSVFNVLAYSS
jgi:hypothetical protein